MKTLAVLLAVLLATGCASQTMSESNANIVMAKNVDKVQGPSGISDVFDFEGQIFAYITFRWEPLTKHGGAQTIEARWFNGEKEIVRRQHQANFGTPPHYVWMSARGTALGAGTCRVDVYANGTFVGQKAFTVVEKR